MLFGKTQFEPAEHYFIEEFSNNIKYVRLIFMVSVYMRHKMCNTIQMLLFNYKTQIVFLYNVYFYFVYF